MAKFKYGMQNLLNLRYKLEDQQKMALAAARIKLREEEDKLSAFMEKKKEYEEEIRKITGERIRLDVLKHLKQAYEGMDIHIEKQREEVKKVAAQVEEEQAKMTLAMRDRKMLESLKEKFYKRYLQDLAYEETLMVDELVTYQYSRRVELKKEGGLKDE